MNLPAASCLSLAIAAIPLPAQAIHLVGPGGLPQIRDALAIAAPGDLLAVLPGSYAPFHARAGVTIAAVVPGSVDITVDPAFVGPCSPCWFEGITELSPPPGQTVRLVGLAFTATWIVFSGQIVYPAVAVTGGRATFEDCSIAATSAFFPALSVQGANVHLQDCTIDAFEQLTGITGLRADSANVTAVGTAIRRHATLGSLIGYGVSLVNSTLHGSHLMLDGDTTAALFADNSQVWLSDTTLRGPAGTCPVGWLGAQPELDRCTLLPAPAGCPAFAPLAPLLGVDRPLPPLSGAPFSLAFRTAPNAVVAVFANTSLDSVPVPGVLAQPLAIAPVGALSLGTVLADGTGAAVATWPIPAGAAFVGRQLWFQGVSGLALPLPASPPAGGTIR